MEEDQTLGGIWVGVGEGGAKGDCQTIGSCREILFECTCVVPKFLYANSTIICIL